MPRDPEEGDPAPTDAGSGPPAISTFSLEGRSVPALYLIGWLGVLLGGGTIAVGVLSGETAASPWLVAVGLVLLAIGLVSGAGSQAIERARLPEAPYRGPSPWLTFAAVIPLTILAFLAILGPLAALGLDPRSPAASAVGLALTALIYAGLVRLLVVGTGALSWRDMGLRHRPAAAIGDLVLGAALALPILLVTGYLGLFLAAFLDRPPSPLPEAFDLTGTLLNAVSAVILAPIGEELFFRGYATTAWERSAGARSAIVRGAIFFALAHVVTIVDAEQALFAFVVRLPIGLALGWLFLARRSLPAAIGLHAAFNGIQVLALAANAGA